MSAAGYSQFEDLTYDDFRRRAADHSLSCYEKIGFPDAYRAGKEEAIFRDILAKLAPLSRAGGTVLDIGPGCSGLAHLLIDHCGRHGQTLLLVDSQEMLDQLPDRPHTRKYPAYYPRCEELFHEYAGRVDAILAYSVLHYVFVEGNVFDFFDRSLGLLAPGGAMLVGDVPNVSKRKRFFGSVAGVRYHQEFTGRDEVPAVVFHRPEPGKIDDGALVGLLLRCRAAGCDAYLLPQAPDLPMANRREDLLICKP
jgi:cyclopropane fatty-acyl-phospholipid synthase-like methyltransferase